MATEQFKQQRILFFISIVLVAMTFAAYEPIRHNDFVRLDDYVYVAENPNVTGGITLKSVIWAFTKTHTANWHPLTWLSHMLDCEIYGLNPLGHHITNVLIHTANTLLLLFLLFKMTGALWRSAFVAAAFSLHPIHVESVAWLAERKDVLSGLFWILTILAYLHYAKRPNIKRNAIVVLCFAMGLMAKPMVVTLPFVLLLLDYWPLERILWRWKRPATTTERQQQQNTSLAYPKMPVIHLIAEKIPMFVLSVISCIITFIVQEQSKGVTTLGHLPIKERIINSLGCYALYIEKIFYPKGLAALYPGPVPFMIVPAILAAAGVLLLLILGRRRRWLIVGLLWYLGTLVPVIGLVHVGGQIMADRYAYLPSIGIFIIVSWGAWEIFSKTHYSKAILGTSGIIVLVIMIYLTRIQVGYWRDSPTLYSRALAVTKNNHIMLVHYGTYLCAQGKYEEGEQYFKKALYIYPGSMLAKRSYCRVLLEQKRYDEAIACYTEALQQRSDWPDIDHLYNGLGYAYYQKGEIELAELNFKKAKEAQAGNIPPPPDNSVIEQTK